MSISYTIDAELGIIRETWSGEVDALELRDYWQRYLADARVLEIRTTLVDLRESTMRFTGAQLSDLVSSVVDPVLQGRSWRTALIVADPVQFGVSRQYQVFAAHYSDDAIFSDPELALQWLLQK